MGGGVCRRTCRPTDMGCRPPDEAGSCEETTRPHVQGGRARDRLYMRRRPIDRVLTRHAAVSAGSRFGCPMGALCRSATCTASALVFLPCFCSHQPFLFFFLFMVTGKYYCSQVVSANVGVSVGRTVPGDGGTVCVLACCYFIFSVVSRPSYLMTAPRKPALPVNNELFLR